MDLGVSRHAIGLSHAGLHSGSVTVEDVAAFRDKCPWRNKPQPLGTARASNLFNRVSLDE